MPRWMWKAVETEIRKIRLVKAEEKTSKERTRTEEEKTEKEKDNGSKESSRGVENLGW